MGLRCRDGLQKMQRASRGITYGKEWMKIIPGLYGKVPYFGEFVLEELPGHAEVTFLADTSKCSCVHRETWLLPRGTWLLLCLDSAAVRAGIREMSSFAVND